MEKRSRNRQRRNNPQKKLSQVETEVSLPPVGKVFIISPILCFEALEYISQETLSKVDAKKAIKDLLYLQQNLEDMSEMIATYEERIKQSFDKLDTFWLKRFNKRIYDQNSLKSIDKLRGIKSPYTYRQAYFDLHPKEKYNSSHPLQPIQSSNLNLLKFQLSQVENIYMRASVQWEEYIKRYKGPLLEFYESFIEVIDQLIVAKNL